MLVIEPGLRVTWPGGGGRPVLTSIFALTLHPVPDVAPQSVDDANRWSAAARRYLAVVARNVARGEGRTCTSLASLTTCTWRWTVLCAW